MHACASVFVCTRVGVMGEEQRATVYMVVGMEKVLERAQVRHQFSPVS